MPPSQACEACRRSRRVCDSQRPSCRRCQANGTACAYQNEQPVNFTFIDQNNAAAVASRRAALRRTRGRTVIELDASLLAREPVEIPPEPQQLQMVTPVQYTLDSRVLERFISRWATGLTALGCLESVQEVFDASAADSAIRSAILATAYGDLAVSERHGDHGTASYKAYFGTLRRLQYELTIPDFAASNDLLAAVLTIDAYELLFLDRNEAIGVHTQAIMRLLALRKDRAVNQQSYFLWRSALQRINARRLFSNDPVLDSASLYSYDASSLEVSTIRYVSDVCEALANLRREREKLAQHTNRQEVERLCNVLRTMRNRADEWYDYTVPEPKPVLLITAHDQDVNQAFPHRTATAYDNGAVARDRLLFHMCSIKIFEALIGVQIEDFASERTGGLETSEARDFLVAAQPDMLAMQSVCRSALDLVPYHIGYVDSHGNVNVSASNLNDTGVLTVKRLLKAIVQIECVPQDIKTETSNILSFLEARKHILRQS